MELLGGPGGPAGGEPEPSPDPQALHEGAQPPPATLLLTIHTRSPIVGRWLLQATLPTVPTTCPHPLLHPAPERGPCAFPATARKEGGECTGQGRCTCGPTNGSGDRGGGRGLESWATLLTPGSHKGRGGRGARSQLPGQVRSLCICEHGLLHLMCRLEMGRAAPRPARHGPRTRASACPLRVSRAGGGGGEGGGNAHKVL